MRRTLSFGLVAVWLGLAILAACSLMTTAPPAPEPAPAAAAPEPTPASAAPFPEPPAFAADAAPASSPERVDFTAQILPIVDRCRPCHFEGGKVYAKLPFDEPDTLRGLGEKLFTRIKDADEQALIRAFLAQPAADEH